MENSDQTSREERVFSPSRAVWRTQMAKGIYTPHRVSRITCIVNQLLAERITDLLRKIEVLVYDETGRIVRERIKSRSFGLPGEITKLESSSVRVFRFTVPRKHSEPVIRAIIHVGSLHIPGRGSVFAQELMEFSKEPPEFNVNALNEYVLYNQELPLLNKLSYVICVLSDPGSGEQLARIALDLGICVPMITFGTGNDIRDQLGLIRITIPAEKEIVHLVMPEQDSESVIKLLVEQGRLDKPGKGFIYQTPVSLGLIDTRMKTGKQKSAATMEQIIAAIDQLKAGTTWRRRLDADIKNSKIGKSMMPQDNCEISIVSDEDRIDLLRETCLKIGAAGATTSKVVPITSSEKVLSTMIRSAISVPAQITDDVVDKLLEISTIQENNTDRIQILDSPAAYVRSL
jgi:nitrogen regulatory protein PII